MSGRLRIKLDLELFQPSELLTAEAQAKRNKGVIYSWNATDKDNWLQRGVSTENVIGFVIFPTYLSDGIYAPSVKA